MGVLSFINELGAQKQAREQAELQRQFLAQQAELARQAALKEIEARGQSQQSVLQKAAEIEKQQKKEEAFRQWQSSAMQDIRDRSELGTLLFNQDPTMQRGEELPAAAAAMRGFKFQPELAKSSAAEAKTAFNRGLLPTMEGLGLSSGSADTAEADARRNLAYNNTETAVQRRSAIPSIVNAEDEAAIANAKKSSAMANYSLPGLAEQIGAQQEADVAANKEKQQQSLFGAKIPSLLNPQAAANAQNQGFNAAAAKSGLESNSGGVFTPGVGNQTIGNYMVNPDVLSYIQRLLTSSMTNRNIAPPTPAPTTSTQLTPRQPIMLPSNITIPMQ